MTEPLGERLTTEQLSKLLTAAADYVRDLAAATTNGRWNAGRLLTPDRSGSTAWVESKVEHANGAAFSFTVAEFETDQGPGDAAWVAALSPAVAAPHIEAWLREAAEMCGEWEDQMTESAIALAKMLCPELAVPETARPVRQA
jgi:hypothetical protein